MKRSNVLPRQARPTKKSYRAAVKAIVLNLQAEHSLNDPELADRLGCSAPTIANARKEATNLDGVTLANIEYEFGPGALDPFLDLGGTRSVPKAATCSTDANHCLAMVEALRVLIETQQPNSDGGSVTTHAEVKPHLTTLREARTSLDALIELAEMPAVRSAA